MMLLCKLYNQAGLQRVKGSQSFSYPGELNSFDTTIKALRWSGSWGEIRTLISRPFLPSNFRKIKCYTGKEGKKFLLYEKPPSNSNRNLEATF